MDQSGPVIVVAMTTCNGERFVGEQLASIARQTVLPAALVIGDDASTDATLAIVEKFADAVPFTVQVVRGSERIGLHANSDRVLSIAAGMADVVVPSDHDDVWDPRKLEAIRDAFRARPELSLWFSDGMLIDGDGRSLQSRLWPLVSLDADARAELEAGGGLRRLLHWSTVTGGTMAVRATIIPHLTPTPYVERNGVAAFFQDGWLAVIARLLGEFAIDGYPYLHYRRHRAQMSANRESLLAGSVRLRKAAAVREYSAVTLVLERIRRDPDAPWIPRHKNELVALESFLATRLLSRGTRFRVRLIVKQVANGSYRRFARGLRTAAYDIAVPGPPPDDQDMLLLST